MQGWKTLTGIALALCIGLASIVGVQPAEMLPAWAEAILMVAAAVYAAYGRIVARGPAAPQLRSGSK